MKRLTKTYVCLIFCIFSVTVASVNIDVEFERKEGENLQDFSKRILSVYNPEEYKARAECVGNTCKCLLPDQWQADKFPSERTDLYFYFDREKDGDVDCND